MKINPIKMRAYKCVTNNGSGLRVSWAYRVRYFGMGLEYPTNRLIKPKLGRIFVFDSFDNALKFFNIGMASDDPANEIWEVEAHGVERQLDIVDPWGEIFVSSFADFWQGKQSLVSVTTAPAGTLTCKSLVLKKLVHQGNWCYQG